MHEARFYREMVGRRVQCTLCPHSCILHPGQSGICEARQNRAGHLYSLVYGVISALATDPIEKKPLYHFYPGRQVLSMGSLGCNLKCDFCQNHHISQPDDPVLSRYPLRQPGEVVEKAERIPGNLGLAYTYNEPTTSFEFVSDCAREAHEKGMKNVFISNGYIQAKALEDLLPVMDAFNIDLKAFSNDFYRDRAGGRLDPVLRSIETIAGSDAHLEITFLLIPGQNDDPALWRDMLRWIQDHCGKDVVLHVSRYAPRFRLDAPPTPIHVMEDFIYLAREHLSYVYPGNIPDMDSDTRCPSCGSLLIARKGYRVSIQGLNSQGQCSHCLETISGKYQTVP